MTGNLMWMWNIPGSITKQLNNASMSMIETTTRLLIRLSRHFVPQFGVDAARPEEIFSVEQEEEPVDYISWYTVKGKILQLGGYEIDIGPVHIIPRQRNEVMLPTLTVIRMTPIAGLCCLFWT